MSISKSTTAVALVLGVGAALASTAPATAASQTGENCSLSAASSTGENGMPPSRALHAERNDEISEEKSGNCMQNPQETGTPQQDMQEADEILVAADQSSEGTVAEDEVKQQPATSDASAAEAKVGESEETHTKGATGMAAGAATGPTGTTAPEAGGQQPAADGSTSAGSKSPAGARDTAGAPSAQPPDSVRTGEAKAGRQQTGASSGADVEGVEAEDIVGRDVVNRNGDEVGEVSALVVDQKKDVYVVVSIGGFLGIGDREVAIPLTEFDINEDAVTLMSQQTADELKSLPEYDEQNYEPADSVTGASGNKSR